MIRALPEKRWMRTCLLLAGLYNLIWGVLAVALPGSMMDVLGFADPSPTSVLLWQGLGMVIGVYGLGYWIAARRPLVHWPVVFIGFLGKVLGPLGVAKGVLDGVVPANFALASFFNDLIWWVPFAIILVAAWRAAPARGAMGLRHAGR